MRSFQINNNTFPLFFQSLQHRFYERLYLIIKVYVFTFLLLIFVLNLIFTKNVFIIYFSNNSITASFLNRIFFVKLSALCYSATLHILQQENCRFTPNTPNDNNTYGGQYEKISDHYRRKNT